MNEVQGNRKDKGKLTWNLNDAQEMLFTKKGSKMMKNKLIEHGSLTMHSVEKRKGSVFIDNYLIAKFWVEDAKHIKGKIIETYLDELEIVGIKEVISCVLDAVVKALE